ncbi:MAG: tRNA (guanosine(37)-N1)-methyltransferase TrmD [Clostridia bacterium]|nr:tRNA (guanosine(37)-N1)-methyltransferase TrmD [Clostridia bacterium]
MKITILTIFPEMFAPLHESILGRAQKAGLLEIREVDIRPYAKNKHHNTDDAPYGGGAGMVMLAQPIVDAVRDVQGERFEGRRIYLSPRGQTLTQRKAEELAKEKELILLCGHYEGVDQRARDLCIDEEISIGDYVLTGGELGAMVLADCVARLIPGVLGSEQSAQTESFSSGLLEYPQYTRPREFEGLTVPEPLLNGNHAHVKDWQLEQSLYITLRRRPELARAYLDGRHLTRKQKRIVDGVFERIRAEDAPKGEQAAQDGALEPVQAGEAEERIDGPAAGGQES